MKQKGRFGVNVCSDSIEAAGFPFLTFFFIIFFYVKALAGPSEALGLLQEAGLGGQRHEGRGQTPEAHCGAEAQVRGGQQWLEDADEAEGGAAVGDEVDLVAVGTQEGREVLQGFGPGRTHAGTHSATRVVITFTNNVCLGLFSV